MLHVGCYWFLCSVLLSHSALFSNGGSNAGGGGETIGPFAAKLGERRLPGLGGVEVLRIQAHLLGLAGKDRRMQRAYYGPGKGFWDEMQRPCKASVHSS